MRYEIFPIPVWHIEGAPQELIDELYKKVSVIKENTDLYNIEKTGKKSNQGGYQTSQLAWEKFHPEGIKYIENEVNNIFSPEYSIKISGWWYNINPKGSWNLPHTHTGIDYALVLYLTDSDNLLTFMTPHHNYHSEMRLKEPDNQSINAKKGDILIFPGNLVHYVMPNPREEDRVSISMNLQLCGK